MLTHVQQFASSAAGAALCVGALGFACVLLFMPAVITRLAPLIARKRDRQLHQTHKTAVPRLGGIAIAAAFIVCAPAAALLRDNGGDWQLPLALIVTSLAMFGLGLCDDLRPLGARKKLLGQVLIATLAFYLGLRIEAFKNPLTGIIYSLGPLAFPATILWLVAFTNLVNLIDGIDGLAGGISLMLMCLLAYAGFQQQSFSFFIAVGMAGALVAFLRYNFPPARIYLGDGGAYFLGFLIGAIAIRNSQKGTIAAALIAPIFALALPILDVAFSIVRRAVKGLPIFRPDRRHIHHRLLQSGHSHKRAVLTLYGISLVFLGIGFVAFWSGGRLLPILVGCVFLVLLLIVPSLGLIKNWLTVGAAVGNSLEMRKEVQYALLLRNWLEMEAERCDSVESLWQDLAFMARKVGFSELTLRAGNESRVWAANARENDEPRLFTRQELQIDGASVYLEFGARSQDMNERLFHVAAELVAEAWLHASLRWRECRNLPFTLPAPVPGNAVPVTAEVAGVNSSLPA